MKYGIIGLGSISKFFIHAIDKNPNSSLVCILDQNISKKKEIPKNVKFYTDFESFIKDSFDTVIICTPNLSHYELIKKSIVAKKKVICEKPLTIEISEAKKLENLSKKNNCSITTVFHRRYNKEVFNLIKSKKLKNNIARIHARYLEEINEHSSANWYFNSYENGGGCIIDNGSNIIDVIYNLLGNIKVKDVHIGFAKYRGVSYDSNAYISLSYKSSKVTLELDWHSSEEKKDLVIYTKKGKRIELDFLKEFTNFKSSLWHEYETFIKEYEINKKYKSPSIIKEGITVIKIIDKIFKKYKYSVLNT